MNIAEIIGVLIGLTLFIWSKLDRLEDRIQTGIRQALQEEEELRKINENLTELINKLSKQQIVKPSNNEGWKR